MKAEIQIKTGSLDSLEMASHQPVIGIVVDELWIAPQIRNQGYARRAIEGLQSIGLSLYVCPSAFYRDDEADEFREPLDSDQLVAFYRSLGFTWEDPDDSHMTWRKV